MFLDLKILLRLKPCIGVHKKSMGRPTAVTKHGMPPQGNAHKSAATQSSACRTTTPISPVSSRPRPSSQVPPCAQWCPTFSMTSRLHCSAERVSSATCWRLQATKSLRATVVIWSGTRCHQRIPLQWRLILKHRLHGITAIQLPCTVALVPHHCTPADPPGKPRHPRGTRSWQTGHPAACWAFPTEGSFRRAHGVLAYRQATP